MEDKMRVLILFLVVLMSVGCAVQYEVLDDIRNQLAAQEAQLTMLRNQLRQYEEQEQAIALQEQVIIQQEQITIQVTENVPQTQIRVHNAMTSDEIARLYNRGLRHYESREFAAAIRDFQAISNHSPNHVLAANAVYWTGESFFALADFAAARTEFQRVTEQYPNSNKFIDAHVKIAMTWIRQGRRDLARNILEGIRRDFPNYERMDVVNQQLRLLRG